MQQQALHRRVKFTKSFELHEQHDADEVRVCVMLGVCVCMFAARACSNSQNSSSFVCNENQEFCVADTMAVV